MSDSDVSRSEADHWDAYWTAWDKAVSQEEAGARDPAPLQHWAEYFEREFAGTDRLSLIDVACGHGPVTGVALEAAKRCGTTLDAQCIDYSQSAVDELRRRYPGVEGVACDATEIPFPDRRFDLVVSQFGIEYAGGSVYEEAARLVADEGALHALIHLAGGAIDRECADNLAVVVALRMSQLMPRAREAFAAGFDMIAGRTDNNAFQQADKELAPAVNKVRVLLQHKGPQAAGGLLAKLFEDIAYMYRRMQNYVPDEVFAWFDGMSAELTSYEGRMASMTRAAVDEDGIRDIGARIAASGLSVDEPSILPLAGSGEPAAWIVSARRPA